MTAQWYKYINKDLITEPFLRNNGAMDLKRRHIREDKLCAPRPYLSQIKGQDQGQQRSEEIKNSLFMHAVLQAEKVTAKRAFNAHIAI